MDLFNVESGVWFSLPASQHQVIHLLWTGSGSLQDTTLGDTLNHLQRVRSERSNKINVQKCVRIVCKDKPRGKV